MKIFLLILIAGMAALIIRRVRRKVTYQPTQTIREGDLAVFVPARDAFRSAEQIQVTGEAMTRLLDEGVKSFIVDLSRQGHYMEDSGYGSLVSLRHKGRDIEGFRMVLVCPSERMMAFIRMVKFDIVFEVVETREEAGKLLAAELPEMVGR